MDTQREIETVLANLGTFPRIVWEAIEDGAAHAKWYAEQRQRIEPTYVLERSLANDLVRSRAKSYIRDHAGIEVEDFEQQDVANIGLRARVTNYDVRIWKSPDSNVPYPSTRRKRRFVAQGIQLSFPGNDFQDSTNLVILWNVDSDYKVTHIYLVKPQSAPSFMFERVDTYWTIEIPHPATTLQAPAPLPQPDQTLTWEAVDDHEDESEEDAQQGS